jgi:Rieske Fe-S protein
VAGGIRFAIPDFREGLPSVLLLGKIADFKMNTVTWLRDFELFVRRNETGFEVLSSRCTHLGCTVRRSDEGFSCPCHGARYSADGTVLGGPAREPLPRYRVFVDGQGRVFADRGQIIEAKEPVPPDGE